MNTKCIHCGAEIEEGSTFCNHCGKKQTKTYYKSFDSETYGSHRIIPVVNYWFEHNPDVAIINCKIRMRTGLGLLANKFVLESIELYYELLDGTNKYEYAVEEVSSTTLFSGFGINSTEELLARWKEENPDNIIVYYNGGFHSRGRSALFDIGNRKKVQSFVLYKKERQQTTPVKSA